jgi:hypothetical protein
MACGLWRRPDDAASAETSVQHQPACMWLLLLSVSCRVCREDVDEGVMVEGVISSQLGGGSHVPFNDM